MCDILDDLIGKLAEANKQFDAAHGEFMNTCFPTVGCDLFTWTQKSDEARRRSTEALARVNHLHDALTRHGLEHGCYPGELASTAVN